ncbi:MAG: CocE/NonD family hydrolase [Mucilaginibacter sp.]|nr:CocE/NonD family hydrolase [Mucilaginibacter sp.]
MKKCFLLACFAVSFTSVFAQKLYFPKTNYADSASLDKSVPQLAKQVIAAYGALDKKLPPNDNLVRLHVAAEDYKPVPALVRDYGMAFYGDSVTTKDLDFNYKIYALIMQSHPTDKAQFKALYLKMFDYLYNDMPPSCKIFIESSLTFPLQMVKDRMAGIVKKNSLSDSLTMQDAIAFCRSYALYKAGMALNALTAETAKKLNGNYLIDDSVLVKMPDGGTIALNIIRDRRVTTPQPVILKYDIYAEPNNEHGKRSVLRGYVGITANTRGKRLSPDLIEPFEHDAKDAYFIIDWISKQPWCNGKVGMYGGSYLGFSQWATAKYMHPALKTIVPQVAVGAGIDYPATNNIYMTFMLRWIHYVTDAKMINRADFTDLKKWNKPIEDWFKNGKSFRSLDTIEGRPNAIFQRWLKHPSYDSFWQNMTPQKHEFAKINIPIFTTTGYYDDDQLGAMYYYQQYLKYNKNPNYYLLIGPYSHGGAQAYPNVVLNGYPIDRVANVTIADLVYDWFDYILKGKPRPAILKDKVNFEVMGKNEWLHVPSLDKMHNDTLRFYFGNTPSGKQYPLLAAKPKKSGYILYDPKLADRTGVEFHLSDDGDNIIDTIMQEIKDKLIFKTAPIDKPFAISGAFKAAITASVNKKDMDLVINLYEQTPDGKYFYLTRNIQRASYGKDRGKRQLLQPNKITTINMNNTFITSRQLQKGSRIVLVMGINKSPEWQINYGTGKDVSDETIKDAATPMQVKWYNNSVIKIPILR